MSTYLYSRSGLELQSATVQSPQNHFDLVTFLGVAQRGNIDFLPITWQPALDCIGQGATAEIREASANLQFSFAFKRPVFDQRLGYENFERRLLPCLIAEISTLGLKSIRKHPNIVKLEGVCWEVICSEGQFISRETPCPSRIGGIVPVLVFEKAKYGDLRYFMMQEAGRSLSFAQKMGICVDIAKAVAEMHYHDIVHGDLKPQNVLIFDNEEGGYIARVADFGYSTQWALPNDLVQMPRSRPWDAPEWHHRGFTPAQAMKMDAYSFGMVVLWLLGYAALKDADRTFGRDLNTATEAIELARPLAESMFQATKQDFNHFFNATLTHNETNRCSDFDHLQELLYAEKVISHREVFRQADGSRFVWINGHYMETLKDSISPETVEFQVIPSMYQLYFADFRVRIHLANALLRRLAILQRGPDENPKLQSLFLQCAVCYEIGFGVARDPSKSQELLGRCHEYDRVNFSRELYLVKGKGYGWARSGRESSNYRKMFLAQTGNGAPKYNLALSYFRQGNIEDIELQYRKEILDAENSLGASHYFVSALKKELKDILLQRGQQSEAEELKAQLRDRSLRWSQYDPSRDVGIGANLDAILSLSEQTGRAKDAEELCRKILASASKRLGVDSPTTLEALWTLATIAGNQGRWEEAERLSVQALDASARELGETHPDNMARTRDLARIFAKQEKWDEAETLVARTMESSRKILGEEHVIHISSVAHLVWMRFLRQEQRPPHLRQWAAIETQQTEVMKKYISVLGQEYRGTVVAMNNLAMIWSQQRLWRIAKTLFGQVIKTSKEVYGEEHPETLEYMGNMVSGLHKEMIRKESLVMITGRRPTCGGPIHRDVFELSAKIRGWDDLGTVNLAGWLVWTLTDQRQFEEAEVLQTRIADTRTRLQGEKHPDALRSIRALAIIIRKQGRLREALKVLEKWLHDKSRFVKIVWRAQLCLGLVVA